MANYLSIAAATATLVEIVQGALNDVTSGVIVRAGLPKEELPPGEKEVNIYPYLMSQEAQIRNSALPLRAPDGKISQNPQIAMRLHYVVSFSCQDPLLPEIMMGKIISTFNALPRMSPDQITRAISPTGNFPHLSESNFAEQRETVRIMPEYLSLEELSKLWSVFFQVAHRPSLQYSVSPIMIDGEMPPALELPSV